jgi:hypothetical protein
MLYDLKFVYLFSLDLFDGFQWMCCFTWHTDTSDTLYLNYFAVHVKPIERYIGIKFEKWIFYVRLTISLCEMETQKQKQKTQFRICGIIFENFSIIGSGNIDLV